eukprot:scaffold25732_cov70-Phaeocystis_antarctica.AAC.2
MQPEERTQGRITVELKVARHVPGVRSSVSSALGVLVLAGRADDEHWHRCAHGLAVEREPKREAAKTRRTEPHEIGPLASVGEAQLICSPLIVGNQLGSEAAAIVGRWQRVRDWDSVDVARLKGQEDLIAKQQLHRRAAQQPIGQHLVDYCLRVGCTLRRLNALAGRLNLAPRAERRDWHGLHVCEHRHCDILVPLRVDENDEVVTVRLGPLRQVGWRAEHGQVELP